MLNHNPIDVTFITVEFLQFYPNCYFLLFKTCDSFSIYLRVHLDFYKLFLIHIIFQPFFNFKLHFKQDTEEYFMLVDL